MREEVSTIKDPAFKHSAGPLVDNVFLFLESFFLLITWHGMFSVENYHTSRYNKGIIVGGARMKVYLS